MNGPIKTFESQVKEALKILTSETDYSEVKKKLVKLGLGDQEQLLYVFRLVFDFFDGSQENLRILSSFLQTKAQAIREEHPIVAAIAFWFAALCIAKVGNMQSSFDMEDKADALLAIKDLWVLDLKIDEMGGVK